MINPLDLEWDRISPKVGSTFLKSVLTQKTLRSILQDVDKSFVKSKEASYRFINDEDIVVEIITPITSVEQSNDSFFPIFWPYTSLCQTSLLECLVCLVLCLG